MLLELSDLSNLLNVRFVKFKSPIVKGVYIFLSMQLSLEKRKIMLCNNLIYIINYNSQYCFNLLKTYIY